MIHAAPLIFAGATSALTALFFARGKKKVPSPALTTPSGDVVVPVKPAPDIAAEHPAVPGASPALPAVPVSTAANIPSAPATGPAAIAQTAPAAKPGAPTQAEVVLALVTGDDTLVDALKRRGLSEEAKLIDDAQGYLARARDIDAPTPKTAPVSAAVQPAKPATRASEQSAPKGSKPAPKPAATKPVETNPAAKPAPVKTAPKPLTPEQVAARKVGNNPDDKTAVADFQRMMGLKADGLYGPMTARQVFETAGYAPIPAVFPKSDWNGEKTRSEWRSYISGKRSSASASVRSLIDADLKAL